MPWDQFCASTCRLLFTFGCPRTVVPNLSNIATHFRTSNQEATPILKISCMHLFFSITNCPILRFIREVTAISHSRPCRPPRPLSEVVETLWKVGSVLNKTRKIFKKFSDFYFSSYHRKLGWFFSEKLH